MVFNATVNNISSARSWCSVLLLKEIGVLIAHIVVNPTTTTHPGDKWSSNRDIKQVILITA